MDSREEEEGDAAGWRRSWVHVGIGDVEVAALEAQDPVRAWGLAWEAAPLWWSRLRYCAIARSCCVARARRVRWKDLGPVDEVQRGMVPQVLRRG